MRLVANWRGLIKAVLKGILCLTANACFNAAY